jgi:hypothetical protein
MYGLGYGALRPVYAVATTDLFPSKQLSMILGVAEAADGLCGDFDATMAEYLCDRLGHDVISFSLVLGATALSGTSCWFAAPRRTPVVRR